jgi:hypothetical protein
MNPQFDLKLSLFRPCHLFRDHVLFLLFRDHDHGIFYSYLMM